MTHEDPTLSTDSFFQNDEELVSGDLQGEATASAPQGTSRPARGGSVEALILVVLAFLLALFLKQYVAEAYEIKGRSMEPTFENGQRVVVLKTFYGLERGDIVVFSSTEDPSKDLIKRIVAGPKDKLEIVDGELHVNGEPLPEEYLLGGETGFSRYRRRTIPLDESSYWVLGDNRPDSHDSRYFGAIPADSIKGKVVLRWWPFDSLRSF